MTHNIVGTKSEDLTQIYNGRIIIRGTLSLKNVVNDLSLMQPIEEERVGSSWADQPTDVVVSGQPFNSSAVRDQFWMISVDQVRTPSALRRM